MTVFLQGLRFFYRELWQAEMRLVLLALTLTVASMATVGLLVERIGKALQYQSNELLGADLVVASSRPIPRDWQARAERDGLQTARFNEFPSVLLGGTGSSLVEVKAVTPRYPLRGELLVRDAAGRLMINEIPPPGMLWADNNLLRKISLATGDKVSLGKSDFILGGVIDQEPDRGGNLFALAPRVLMNQADLAATGLLGEGSRARYRLLLAGEPQIIRAYQTWLEPRLAPHYHTHSVRDERPEVRTPLQWGERFLALSLVVTIILACLAMRIAMQAWMQRRLLHAGVLRTIGLTRYRILALYLSQLLCLVVLACALAVALAWGLQQALVGLIQPYMAAALPPTSIRPALVACALGLLLVLAFSLPIYWRLAAVAPMLVLRTMPEKLDADNATWAWGLLGLVAVIGWLVADLRLLLITACGLAGALLVLAILAHGLSAGLRQMARRLPAGYRLGVDALLRHRRETITSMSVFGLAFVFIILLTLIRTDVLDQWQARLPADTPNVFLLNILPDEVAAVQQRLAQRGLENAGLAPMVRARLTAINEREVSAKDYADTHAQRLVSREFNLSWADVMPAHNRLASGAWWEAHNESVMPQWSVETGIAETLGINMGDELIFDAAGRMVKGKVTSLRNVSWDSFKVNFFVIGTPPMLSSIPARYISSFYLAPEQRHVTEQLVRHHPTVLVLDVDVLMQRVRGIINKSSYAMEAAFVFTLIAAILLTVAMIMSGRHIRQKETALLRAMGATSTVLAQAQRAEFVLLGFSAGGIAVILANVLAWWASSELFEIDFRFNFMLAGGVVLCGIGLMLATGWSVLRYQRHWPPLSILRQS